MHKKTTDFGDLCHKKSIPDHSLIDDPGPKDY